MSGKLLRRGGLALVLHRGRMVAERCGDGFTAAPADYSQAQVWLHGPHAGTPPGQNPDAGFGLPADTVWMNGHDGQAIALVPSCELAMLRLGLMPSALQHRPPCV